MNNLEALLAGKRPDRVPFFPMHMKGFCAKNLGYPVSDMYINNERTFWAQVWTQQQYGMELLPQSGYAAYGAWEFGGEIKLPEGPFGQAPAVIRHPIEGEEDIERLEKNGIPDIRTSGSIPMNIEFSKLQAKNGLPVTYYCGTPFTRAANICGVTRFMRWLIKRPDLAKRLIKLTIQHFVDVTKLYVETFGADKILAYTGNPTESDQMISPKQFEEFCLPYTIELHEKVFALGVKAFNFHACGDQNSKLAMLAQIPMGNPGIISVGHEVDLNMAIKYLGEKNVIVGNVEPAIVQTGTPEQVYELCRRCIEKGKKAPRGYALATGCEVPPNAPPFNVYTMQKAINDFGQY